MAGVRAGLLRLCSLARSFSYSLDLSRSISSVIHALFCYSYDAITLFTPSPSFLSLSIVVVIPTAPDSSVSSAQELNRVTFMNVGGSHEASMQKSSPPPALVPFLARRTHPHAPG